MGHPFPLPDRSEQAIAIIPASALRLTAVSEQYNKEGIIMYQIKIRKQVKKFEEHLIVDKGFGRTTTGGYCRALSIALRRMVRLCPRYDDIKKLILWMHERNYSYSHIVNTSLAIEHFTAYKGNPVKLGRPKKPRKIIKDTMTESEISRIIAGTEDIRQKSIISLLAYSGIRNQELCNLKLEDVNLGANEIRVLGGKNTKDRIVNNSSECTNTLIEYLKQHMRSNGEFLFTTLKNREQLATGDVRKIVRRARERAGLEKRIFPHLFRHSLAVNLLKRGAGIILIKNQLGHAFIESTMIYVESTPMRAKSEYDFYKPAYM